VTDPVLLEIPSPGVALVTLNRPERLNALEAGIFGALSRILSDLERDRSVKVVVLTGAGRAFCAGHDLDEFGWAG
jgi:enoyl-CoA hydratase